MKKKLSNRFPMSVSNKFLSRSENKMGIKTKKVARNKCMNNAILARKNPFSFFVTKSERIDDGTP